MRRWYRSRLFATACLLAGFTGLVQAQAVPGAPAEATPQPLREPLTLRLAQEQRFRVGVVVNNTGSFPDKFPRLGTLVGEGSMKQIAEGIFWRLVIQRSQVDGHTLTDSEPLMVMESLTDARGQLLHESITFTRRMAASEEARKHAPYLIASGFALGGMVALTLPDEKFTQGKQLGSMRQTITNILAYTDPGAKTGEDWPNLKVIGTRNMLGKDTLVANARGPVNFFYGPVGAATVQTDSQIDIALDSGLPLSGQIKVSGVLPAGAGQMDFGVRATLRPY